MIGGVSACATCDGFFYKGKEVLVVGGGDTAMEEATFLTKFAPKVTVVHRRDELRASKIMQERAFANPKIAWLWDSVIEKILGAPGDQGDGRARAHTSRPARSPTSPRAASSWPSATSRTPRSSAASSPWIRRATSSPKAGTTATSVAGVFAAGDVADPRYRQAVTAAGTGCMAAIDAERFLEAEAPPLGLSCLSLECRVALRIAARIRFPRRRPRALMADHLPLRASREERRRSGSSPVASSAATQAAARVLTMPGHAGSSFVANLTTGSLGTAGRPWDSRSIARRGLGTRWILAQVGVSLEVQLRRQGT